MNVCHHPQEWQVYLCHPCGISALHCQKTWLITFSWTFQTLHFLIKIMIKDNIFTGWQGREKRVTEDFDTLKFSLQYSVRNLKFCCTGNCRDESQENEYVTLRDTALALFSRRYVHMRAIIHIIVWQEGHIVDIL